MLNTPLSMYCNCIAKGGRGVAIHRSVRFSSAAVGGGGKPKSAKRVDAAERGHQAPFGCGLGVCWCVCCHHMTHAHFSIKRQRIVIAIAIETQIKLAAQQNEHKVNSFFLSPFAAAI